MEKSTFSCGSSSATPCVHCFSPLDTTILRHANAYEQCVYEHKPLLCYDHFSLGGEEFRLDR